MHLGGVGVSIHRTPHTASMSPGRGLAATRPIGRKPGGRLLPRCPRFWLVRADSSNTAATLKSSPAAEATSKMCRCELYPATAAHAASPPCPGRGSHPGPFGRQSHARRGRSLHRLRAGGFHSRSVHPAGPAPFSRWSMRSRDDSGLWTADLTGLLYADGMHDSLYRSGGISLLHGPLAAFTPPSAGHTVPLRLPEPQADRRSAPVQTTRAPFSR